MTDKIEAKDSHAPKGLEDVVAGPSAITFLDGLKGRMIYRGYDVIQIADKTIFEEIVHLLWHGDLPNRTELDALKLELAEARSLPPDVLTTMRQFPKKSHPMDVLRAGVCLLAMTDSDTQDNSPAANRRKAARLVARMATLSAAWHRIRNGKTPLAPDPTLSHSANYLYMVTGEKPDPVSVQAMDLYLSLLADHDLNASTFTARVIVSTLSDIHAALAGAIGALKGPLHGGANEKAMEMFLEIGDPAKTEKWVEKAIAEKRKIMGFGHRVYKVEDPRSALLKKMAERMGEIKKEPRWYQISVKVADTVPRLKGLNTNVDFYSASVLYLLGVPIDLFTTVFAVGRAAGWCAHVFEQLGDNRLIRPRSEYTGPLDRVFLPLEKRP